MWKINGKWSDITYATGETELGAWMKFLNYRAMLIDGYKFMNIIAILRKGGWEAVEVKK